VEWGPEILHALERRSAAWLATHLEMWERMPAASPPKPFRFDEPTLRTAYQLVRTVVLDYWPRAMRGEDTDHGEIRGIVQQFSAMMFATNEMPREVDPEVRCQWYVIRSKAALQFCLDLPTTRGTLPNGCAVYPTVTTEWATLTLAIAPRNITEYLAGQALQALVTRAEDEYNRKRGQYA
jgi:hypothetical protein